jgi:DNA-binding transcriptional ArsR family regulator
MSGLPTTSGPSQDRSGAASTETLRYPIQRGSDEHRYHRSVTMAQHDPGYRVDLSPAVMLFRGLGDGTRLAIVHELARGERRVVDLTRALGLAQSTVSAHLACLRDCGLVDGRPLGRQMLYRLTRPELLAVLAAAEELLAATGNAVALCPAHADGAAAEAVPS